MHNNQSPDHFVIRDGIAYAGEHMLVDLDGCPPGLLSDDAAVEGILREAAVATGATILSGHFHHFGEGCGVTGVLVLAESHVTVHTWPERQFAAVDVFVCGDCSPRAALDILRRGFMASGCEVSVNKRGARQEFKVAA